MGLWGFGGVDRVRGGFLVRNFHHHHHHLHLFHHRTHSIILIDSAGKGQYLEVTRTDEVQEQVVALSFANFNQFNSDKFSFNQFGLSFFDLITQSYLFRVNHLILFISG